MAKQSLKYRPDFKETLGAVAPTPAFALPQPSIYGYYVAIAMVVAVAAVVALFRFLPLATEATSSVSPGIVTTLQGNPTLQDAQQTASFQGTAPDLQQQTSGNSLQGSTADGTTIQGTVDGPVSSGIGIY